MPGNGRPMLPQRLPICRTPAARKSWVLEVTTGETEKIEPPKKNAAAQALSQLGASKGGKARAQKLSATKRKAIAKKAANARWEASRKQA